MTRQVFVISCPATVYKNRKSYNLIIIMANIEDPISLNSYPNVCPSGNGTEFIAIASVHDALQLNCRWLAPNPTISNMMGTTSTATSPMPV
jgi:hypothetical protein